MSPLDRKSVLGLGLGLAGAGVATVAGMTTDRLLRARRTAVALGTGGEYDVVPDETLEVLADDGVPLHVEVDTARGRPTTAPSDAVVPTVVLCHGYTLSLRSWVFQRRALSAAGYRVVLWDQRGHGRSGSGDPQSYEIDQLGRDLAQVLDEVVPTGPIVLVGHSMGGMTLMSMAEQRPDLVRDRVVGAAFIATSPGGLSKVSWGLGNLLGQLVHRVGPPAVSRLARRQGLIDAARERAREVELFFVNRYSFASPVPLSIVSLTADMIFGTSMEVVSALLPGFDQHDKRKALEQFIGVETLVLSGAEDLLTPPEHSEEIARLVPGAEHVLVNDAGHIIMLEHPQVVNDQLEALLGRAMRGAAGVRGRDPSPRVRRTVTDLAKRRRDSSARRGTRGRSAS